VSWSDNSNDETGFKVDRSSKGKAFKQIATVGANVTTYADTGLNASTTYRYRVRAYNSGGNSSYSNIASATTNPWYHDMNANTDSNCMRSDSHHEACFLSQFRRNRINITSVLAVILAVTVGVVTFRETFGQTTDYSVLELSATGIPSRVNNWGDVAGRAIESALGETQATIWNHGSRRPKHLGKLQGGEHSSASGINDAGEVAGETNTAESIVPFVWTPRGGLRRSPLLAGDNCGQAFGINRHGHVVGYSSGSNGRRAFLWMRGGRVRDLGILPGGSYSSASDINDLDEVAGTSGSPAGDRAVLWTTNGNIRDLGTLPGYASSEASAINNNGDVVGYAKGPRGVRAFLWTQASGMQDLGALAGGNSSRALGINDMGAVVGSSTSSSGDRAFIWTRETGMRDLNSAASVTPGVVFVEAHAINNVGQILVMGSPMHESHMGGETASQCAPAPPLSFLLTPASRW
jgi:probable HAF family extracellular repeat protein